MSEIKRLKYCVNNQWLSSATDKYMPVMNPSLGVQIAETPCCTQSEVDAAVNAAAAVPLDPGRRGTHPRHPAGSGIAASHRRHPGERRDLR